MRGGGARQRGREQTEDIGELTRARGRRWGGRRGEARPDSGGIDDSGRRPETKKMEAAAVIPSSSGRFLLQRGVEKVDGADGVLGEAREGP